MLRKKIQVPHTYVIIFICIIVAAVATWFVPGGQFTEQVRIVDGEEQAIKVFQQVDREPQTFQVFLALFKGFEKQSGIIVFILMIGGAFWIMNESKALNVGIYSFLKYTRRLQRFKMIRFFGVENIIITLIMLLFSMFGAVFGMSEETIAFVILFIPLSVSMGYDSIVGVSMCFLAAGLGFAGAVLNPFTIGVAQGLAGLPLFSGFEYRIFTWVVITILGIAFVLRYANKVKKNPKSSIVYDNDEYWRKDEKSVETEINYNTPKSAWVVFFILLGVMISVSLIYLKSTLTIGNSIVTLPIIPILTVLFAVVGVWSLRKSAHFFVLVMLGYTILYLTVGVMAYDWYITEIAGLFFAMGILSGITMNRKANKIALLFIEGAKDIMSAALVVGLAGGIIVILEDGKIIDTLLHSLSNSMQGFGAVASVSVIYFAQTLINVFIPSGSAQAALTIPIMAPFTDLIGLSRQIAILAFQFGDGFTNMITPTSGVLIGVLGVAKIPYEKWIKWAFPFILFMMFVAWLLLLPPVLMNINGF